MAVGNLLVTSCPVCSGLKLERLPARAGVDLHRCAECGHAFASPQPDDAELSAIYSDTYFLGSATEESKAAFAALKRQSASAYLDLLERTGVRGGRLLEVGCGNGELLVEADSRGYDVAGLDVSPHAVAKVNAKLGRKVARTISVEDLDEAPGSFDACILVDVIEHTRKPMDTLRAIRRLVKPGGVILLATPDLAGLPARVLGRNWFEFKKEHLHYFVVSTVRRALYQAGFGSVRAYPNRKRLTPDYLAEHFRRYPVPVLSRLVTAAVGLLPASIRSHGFNLPTGGIVVVAKVPPLRSRRLLSVIVPAYNEQATLRTVLDRLLAKRFADLDVEIILVEGNSSDGTREIALEYADRPGIQLVLLERARGKGHAVRLGLDRARGDLVIIQDADLEYDVDDYEQLLQPLLDHRAAFVLGSRHSTQRKIREFTNQLLLATILNAGHWMLTDLFNLFYGLRLKDPWTMYKVFRRDCLEGMTFECNRFDFDVELICKLVRAGFEPIELPVNYRSRSFKEGKKIRPFQDPGGWIWAVLKYRFVRPLGAQAG